MKKPRLHRWRLLLALLLAVGAWWAIGWWQSPRPYFEAEYPCNVDSPDQEKAELPPNDVPYSRSARATIWDREGNFLLVDQTYRKEGTRLSLFDLRNRSDITLKARYGGSNHPSNPVRNHGLSSSHRAHPDGTIHCIAQENPVQPADGAPTKTLWEWNPWTDAVRHCKSFPNSDALKISEDGSTLLEMQRCTPLWPHLLIPGNLTNVLGSLAQASSRSTDLVVYRTWSLPDIRCRSTLAIPYLENGLRATLCPQGNYLVFGECCLPPGYTSKKYIEFESRQISALAEYETYLERDYFFDPCVLRVFSTHTGNLVWQYGDDDNNYSPLRMNHGTVTFGGRDGVRHTLHIPSRTWLPDTECLHAASLDKHHIHALLRTKAKQSLWTIGDDGATVQHSNVSICQQDFIACNDTGASDNLLPGAPQILQIDISPHDIDLPHWFSRWLDRYQWFRKWKKSTTMNYSVLDYSKNRTVWSMSETVLTEPSTSIGVSTKWLMVSQVDGQKKALSIQLFALPFPSWSPWWARGAGLFIFLMAWLLNRGRGHAVLSVPPAG